MNALADNNGAILTEKNEAICWRHSLKVLQGIPEPLKPLPPPLLLHFELCLSSLGS